MTTPEEWERIRTDLIKIICNPNNGERQVKSAFLCLCAITDNQKNYTRFPDIADALKEHHPRIAQRFLAHPPERFVQEPVLAEP
jgi:hypothetical protein